MPLPVREYDRSLNSEIERLLYQIEVVRMDATGLVGNMADEAFNWTPEAGKWSIGQCLNHLNVSNRQWMPLLEEAIRNGREKAILDNGPYSYGIVSRLAMRAVEPPVKFRVGAPKSLQPGDDLSAAPVIEEFVRLHERIETLLRESSGLDLVRIKVPSSFTKLVKFSLGAAFWVITGHDRRHILQARGVRSHPEFPSKA